MTFQKKSIFSSPKKKKQKTACYFNYILSVFPPTPIPPTSISDFLVEF